MSVPENPPPAGGDEPGRGLSGVQRAGIVLGALAVLLIVFLVLRGGDNGGSSSSSAPQTASSPSAATGSAQSPSTSRSDPSGGSTSTSAPAAPAAPTIRVVNGRPQGGVKTVSVKKNDPVVLKVQSDVADEIHVHGYDLKKDVPEGGSVMFTFNATIEGRFEVELEHAATQIANLEVTPS
jgi:FtsP/CotA-like multicopper oxidase with cupredoxin domain